VPTPTTAQDHPRAAASELLTYSVEEAAVLLGIGRGLAYEMVRDGSLPGLRLGQRRILVPRGALEALLGSSSMASAPGGQSVPCT
jgi:excisionase family DNA binding protein